MCLLLPGNSVVQLNPTNLTAVGSARSISSVFRGTPANVTEVDAAVSFQGHWPSKKTYLFVGDQCYRYVYLLLG